MVHIISLRPWMKFIKVHLLFMNGIHPSSSFLSIILFKGIQKVLWMMGHMNYFLIKSPNKYK
jgi:hypothetical protein